MAVKNKSNSIVPIKLQKEKRYTVEKLRENCYRLFGVSASTFIGATYGITDKYTVEEMKSYIEKWRKKGVK